MARLQRMDRSLSARLDEFESRLFQLKIVYEKYFSGIERLEPSRDLDDIRRMSRDLTKVNWGSSGMNFRFQSLKARYIATDLYITRNLIQIERGTHPKFKFRADLSARQETPAQPVVAARPTAEEREEQAIKGIFQKYIDARKECNLPLNVNYDAFKDIIKKQTEQIKSAHSCSVVRFRVAVENGQARLKAIPIKQEPVDNDPS